MRSYIERHRNLVTGLLVLAIVALGLVLRLHNISEYKFYPDSYQNLLVAHNLSSSGSEVGPLGQGGMYYPDALDWTRPLYASLMVLGHKLGMSWHEAGRAVALTASLLAIPAAFVLLWRIGRRRLPAVLAALLLAVSFNYVVWSGFVMTEALSVLVVLLFLERLVTISQAERFRLGQSLTTGGLLGLCLLTRYEYLLLVVSAYALLRLYSLDWRPKFWTIILAAASTVAVWFAFYPMHFDWSVYVNRFGILTIVVLLSLGVIKLHARYRQRSWMRRLRAQLVGWAPKLTLMLAIAGLVFSVAVLTGLSGPRGLRQFMVNDIVLYGLALSGLLYIWRQSAYRRWAVMITPGIVLLVAAYQKTNPGIGRYYTHLIPLLVIPAALMLEVIIRRVAGFKGGQVLVSAALLSVVLAAQIAWTYRGMHYWDYGVWFETSYEEVSARRLHPMLKPDDVLLASFPEPYFYFTGHTTYSLADDYPYIYIDKKLADRDVVIIEDMGMRQVFPQFSDFLQKHMQPYKTDSYKTGATYRYTRQIKEEDRPVQLYVVKASKLWSLLEESR